MPLLFSEIYPNTFVPVAFFQGCLLLICVVFGTQVGHIVDKFPRLRGMSYHRNVYSHEIFFIAFETQQLYWVVYFVEICLLHAVRSCAMLCSILTSIFT